MTASPAESSQPLQPLQRPPAEPVRSGRIGRWILGGALLAICVSLLGGWLHYRDWQVRRERLAAIGVVANDMLIPDWTPHWLRSVMSDRDWYLPEYFWEPFDVSWEGSRLTSEQAAEIADFYSDQAEVSLIGSVEDYRPFGRMKSLRSLSVKDPSIREENLEQIGGLADLEGLSFEGSPVTDAGLRHLARLHHLQGLVVGDAPLTEDSLPIIEALPKLDYLQVENSKISTEVLNQLAVRKPRLEIWNP